MEALKPLILLLPLFGAALIGITGLFSESFRKQEKAIGAIATLAVAVPFVLVLVLFLNGAHTHMELMNWMAVGDFSIAFGYTLDSLGLLMGLIVTGVGALIHVYSIGYMHGDPGFYKYFAYLNLFIFAMLNLILGDNLLVTFLGWEGVGACSYFLIGFWYTDMLKAKAAQKAFIVNRIGDFAFLVAIFICVLTVGSLQYDAILSGVETGLMPGDARFWIAFLLFFAATGKSAQIPLFTWLPDAMAGPTPVSALIHAATMVTSGIYLIARLSPLYLAAKEVMIIISVVGALTAIIAAIIAMSQNDIKKVLAYSTVSQLGYMFMALGAGAFTAAIFHVMTHAFFKACLFLGSGSVIHSMEHTHAVNDPQDIRTMGGLRKYLPSTAKTFWISTLAIAGIPPLAGFFSKDEILAKTFFAGFSGESIYFFVWGVGIITALLTAFYMTRVTWLTFEGKPRFDANTHTPRESPSVMTIPLWILAGLAIVGGFLGLPEAVGHLMHADINWITPFLERSITNGELTIDAGIEWGLIALSILIAVGGVLWAKNLYQKHDIEGDTKMAKLLGGLYHASRNKFWADAVYNAIIVRPYEAFSDFSRSFDNGIIDGTVMGISGVVGLMGAGMRRLQTGLTQNYALLIVAGVVAFMGYLLFG